MPGEAGGAGPVVGGGGSPAPAAAKVVPSGAAPAGKPAVTPQAGAPATETPKPAADPFKPFKAKITFKGKEEEVDFTDPDTAARIAQRARLSDESSKRAKAAEERLEAILKAAAEDEDGFLKAVGIDPEKSFDRRAQERLRRLEMSEEARGKEDADRRAKTAEAKAAQLHRQLQGHIQKMERDAKWAAAEPHFREGLKKRERLGDAAYLELVGTIGDEWTAQGFEATPEQILMEADERDAAMTGGYLKKKGAAGILKAMGAELTPELLWNAIGDDAGRRALMALGLAWHKAQRQQPGVPPAAPPPAKPAAGKEYLTPAQWKEKRGL